ncbi:hypothetical protein JN11_00395 [Mucilaginibacter frigoritolerans]|jgi:hypothetical protein|uniref:Uncharacterized protein n=1 Tax=Mucilaginibacter frigoritolerans TaxID=652788 RepID=A0A562UHJ0_9SPHI|nr:hypothetical protein [Mucilaginibacter frigoritolerans]TWJ04675.1 hypothetical protein JN11_00395 [Mucilaginibacter frigoritolerans]
MGAKKYYEFINSQTGNIIAHLSLSLALNKEEQKEKLEKRKALLATSHKLNLDLIYWQDKDHPIR